MTTDLARGREAFERRNWSDAHRALAAARDEQVLGPAELEQLAVAAYFAGEHEDAIDAWARAHQAWLAAGDSDRAARCTTWLWLTFYFHGEPSQASGWLHRGRRLVGDVGDDCAGRGYLLVPDAYLRFLEGDMAGARAAYDALIRIAEMCGDTDLLAFGLMGQGEVAVHVGDTQRGLALLDDAMVSVTTGEVSDLMAGLLYCSVLDVCMKVLDLRRGVEWTGAFIRWCDESGVVAYRGQCLVHRSQIRQAHGEWGDALSDATRAETWLARKRDPAVALAVYQRGELHRLRGGYGDAAAGFRRAAELGCDPAPGRALLHLGEGRLDTAEVVVRRMLDEAEDVPARLAVLPAAVEVALAAGNVDAAVASCDELTALTDGTTVPYLAAVADHARGAVQLAAGDAAGALVALRRAGKLWRELDMPYEGARTQARLGEACAACGDGEAAASARSSARRAFERLGAVVDLAALDGDATVAGDRSGPLTDRECAVLTLVARGRTNLEISAELSISRHTVARHVQNIFTKIGVGSRAAATAYAYEQGIVEADRTDGV